MRFVRKTRFWMTSLREMKSTAHYSNITQQTNTRSKPTTEKLEKGVKCVQSSLKQYHNDVIDIVLASFR